MELSEYHLWSQFQIVCLPIESALYICIRQNSIIERAAEIISTEMLVFMLQTRTRNKCKALKIEILDFRFCVLNHRKLHNFICVFRFLVKYTTMKYFTEIQAMNIQKIFWFALFYNKLIG